MRAAQRATNRATMAAKTDIERASIAEKGGYDLLVAATIAWSPGIEWEGKPLACTPENANMLYRARDFIGRQIVAFISAESNFLPKAPTG
jgi:hypothetical protein